MTNRSEGWKTTEAGYVKNAIDWVREYNKAEIINMSIIVAETSALNITIQEAATNGRGGKGIILVAASGNEDTDSIGYPSSNSNVIAIGASNQYQERVSQSQSSSDGQTDNEFKGSNYGPGLALVAPGVEILSTNYTDNQTEPNYLNFKGTSFSAPQVSGAAALVLSVNPNLTRVQVKEILESTADQIGNYTYTLGAGENPQLKWNCEMGYGRLNACRAVMLAKAGQVNGLDMVCSGYTTYSLNANPIGAIINWTSSNPSLLSINSTTGLASRIGSDNGEVVISANLSTICGDFEFKKTVWVGKPDLIRKLNGNEIIGIASAPIAFEHNNLEILTNSPTAGMTYNKINNGGDGGLNLTIYTPTDYKSDVYVHPTSTNGYRELALYATNTCGTTEDQLIVYLYPFLKPPYPNPAKDYLTLEFYNYLDKKNLPDGIELISEKTMKTELKMTLNEIMSNSRKIDNNTYWLDISKLPRGVWYLKAYKQGHEPQTIRLLFE